MPRRCASIAFPTVMIVANVATVGVLWFGGHRVEDDRGESFGSGVHGGGEGHYDVMREDVHVSKLGSRC